MKGRTVRLYYEYAQLLSLARGLHSLLHNPPWIMGEAISYCVNVWNSLIFLCPTRTTSHWSWQFKELFGSLSVSLFGSLYLWSVICQVLLNTFQGSVLCRIRPRSKFKMVLLEVKFVPSLTREIIHYVNLPVKSMCLWKAPSKDSATKMMPKTKVLPSAYETALNYADCWSGTVSLRTCHKQAIHPAFLTETWLLSLWTMNALYSLCMWLHAIL